MENYVKGKCVDEPLDRAAIPIPNLPKDFLWMQVKSGSKTQRLTDHALGLIDSNESRTVVWTGSGEGVIRAIACAETIKRSHKMFQIAKIGYKKCEEFWEPKLEGLDRIVVNREIPIIHILLSLDPLDKDEPGYQSPNLDETFWNSNFRNFQNTSKKKKSKITPEEITAMGLQSNSGKGKKNTGHSANKKNKPQKT